MMDSNDGPACFDQTRETHMDVRRPFSQSFVLSRLLLLTLVSLLSQSSGGDRHLPSSNPPEYDPKKVYVPPVSSHGSSPQGARVLDKPLAVGTVVPDPCEEQVRNHTDQASHRSYAVGELVMIRNPSPEERVAGGPASAHFSFPSFCG